MFYDMSWVKENKQRKKGKSGNMVSVFYSKNGDVILKPPPLFVISQSMIYFLIYSNRSTVFLKLPNYPFTILILAISNFWHLLDIRGYFSHLDKVSNSFDIIEYPVSLFDKPRKYRNYDVILPFENLRMR